MSGYKTKYVPSHPKASSSGCVYEHVLIAEKSLGRYLPPKAEIHHVDNNPKNNAKTNLVICQDKSYHRLLHMRTHVIECGGNPNTHRVCSGCRLVLPFADFNKMKSSVNFGLQKYCRICSAKAFARLYSKK